jgi:hypothetical protein
MKSLLFCSVLFTANNSFAQTSASDTSILIRRGDTYYYIDGIKIRGSANLPKSAIEEVSVITGALPINFGDCHHCGCFISIDPKPKPTIKISDKEQNMATE